MNVDKNKQKTRKLVFCDFWLHCFPEWVCLLSWLVEENLTTTTTWAWHSILVFFKYASNVLKGLINYVVHLFYPPQCIEMNESLQSMLIQLFTSTTRQSIFCDWIRMRLVSIIKTLILVSPEITASPFLLTLILFC